MNKKILTLSIGLLLASANASADLIITDASASKEAKTVVKTEVLTEVKKDVLVSHSQEVEVKHNRSHRSDRSVRNDRWNRSDRANARSEYRAKGFDWHREGQSPVPSATINSHNDHPIAVTQSGNKPSRVATVGWAKDLPLSLALSQIIPKDFNLVENGVSLSKEVSWSGDLPWDVVLVNLANAGNFLAHINWDKKEVSLAPRLLAAVAPVTSSPVHVSQNPVETKVAETKVVHTPLVETKVVETKVVETKVVEPKFVAASTPIKHEAKLQSWEIDPAKSLKGNIMDWASKAGYTVVWTGADYPIAAAATFYGAFESAEGPVAKLISAYETSKVPLMVELTTMDKVLYVKNKNYQQTQVIQTTPKAISNSN